jgi:hypothetical protein
VDRPRHYRGRSGPRTVRPPGRTVRTVILGSNRVVAPCRHHAIYNCPCHTRPWWLPPSHGLAARRKGVCLLRVDWGGAVLLNSSSVIISKLMFGANKRGLLGLLNSSPRSSTSTFQTKLRQSKYLPNKAEQKEEEENLQCSNHLVVKFRRKKEFRQIDIFFSLQRPDDRNTTCDLALYTLIQSPHAITRLWYMYIWTYHACYSYSKRIPNH